MIVTQIRNPESPDVEIADVPGLAPCADDHFVVRIQPFTAGGFEGGGHWRTREGYARNPLGLVGPRKERNDSEMREARADNARRARRQLRYRCRELRLDHLLTLTTREGSNEPIRLLGKAERFIEIYRKALAGGELHYVAVCEPHPTNPDHWHVHIGIRGRIHVNVARGIWWALCGGRGEGNVDAKFIRVRHGVDRSARVAKYLGKYLGKTFTTNRDAFAGRKRYRATRVTLEQRRVLVLEARTVFDAYNKLLDALDLWPGDLEVFFYPDGTGFWFNCKGEGMAVGPPPF